LASLTDEIHDMDFWVQTLYCDFHYLNIIMNLATTANHVIYFVAFMFVYW